MRAPCIGIPDVILTESKSLGTGHSYLKLSKGQRRTARTKVGVEMSLSRPISQTFSVLWPEDVVEIDQEDASKVRVDETKFILDNVCWEHLVLFMNYLTGYDRTSERVSSISCHQA